MPSANEPSNSLESLFGEEKLSPPRNRCGMWFEKQAQSKGFRVIAGVDEVGRGSLFGPVVAAAVVLDLTAPRIRGINDSKCLAAEDRERLDKRIRSRAVAWSIASVEAVDVDRINIYQASRVAMRMAVLGLKPPPECVLVDALKLDIVYPQVGIIHGDALSISIAAASIIAKVERDRIMQHWDRLYPEYRLGQNKGYATEWHLAKLEELGPTPVHRFSYAPVASAAQKLLPAASASLFSTISEEGIGVVPASASAYAQNSHD